jgi:hypothetical protein
MHHYWFKPARYWKWFAAYYPVTWQGWVVTIATVLALAKLFIIVDATSHSAVDTLIAMVPWALVILCIFDLITVRTGEYPSWWRKRTAR